MKKIYVLLSIFTTLLLFNCSKENNEIDFKYTAADLKKINDDSSKTWTVNQFYLNFANDILSEFNDCYVDDTFTFYHNKEQVEATLGNTSCFYPNPTEQYATFTLNFYEKTGKIFLNVSRGESLENNFKTRLFILELKEFSETKMIFASGDAPNNYGKTIVFTAN
ncbi:hypothetical protein [Polaribacter sp. BM10]|uniref:hypothetical protein n=1 Tax=Polaribacter sp. BM10 TaxID=1529069 RepID=UPI0011EA5615|nr:hypothetical protein [Polaribacter sp. BM10]